MKILIDNGHGATTPGKCSPDGRLKEYKYTREIATEVVRRLKTRGYDAQLLVPEEEDISSGIRAKRTNAFCNRLGTNNVCLISIHCNAAGNGLQWMKARGWEAWTSKGETQGDQLAECLYDAAESILKPIMPGIQIRTDFSDGDRDKEENFVILAHTKCAACLTENMFQDNREDVDWLLSADGRDAVAKIHEIGIINYINKSLARL